MASADVEESVPNLALTRSAGVQEFRASHRSKKELTNRLYSVVLNVYGGNSLPKS